MEWENKTPHNRVILPKNSVHLRPPTITESMVIDELSKLDTLKSPGPDNIGNNVLKGAKYELSAIITHLFNISIKNSFVPLQWKQANISAIPKTNNPKTATDYRPIALTSSLCKVLERILVKLIMKHTEQLWNTNKQYGFIPGRSTLDAIIEVIEDWEKALDNNEKIHAVFYDFAKAFDLVDHNVLMKKLDKLLPTWIAQYLTDRKQRVKWMH